MVKNYKEMVSVATEATSFSFGDVFVYDIRTFSASLREQNKLPVFLVSERSSLLEVSDMRRVTKSNLLEICHDETRYHKVEVFFIKIASGMAIVF